MLETRRIHASLIFPTKATPIKWGRCEFPPIVSEPDVSFPHLGTKGGMGVARCQGATPKFLVFFFFLSFLYFFKIKNIIRWSSHQVIIDDVAIYARCQIFIRPHGLLLSQLTVN
jgi:hypothetical protein